MQPPPPHTSSAASTRSTTSSYRRLPLPLRGPTPRAARANVSIVFAQADSILPLQGPPPLRRIPSGASPSEVALSRQLDRDSSGEKLGLRSRRSSGATLASVRSSLAGVVGGSASPILQEEDDDQPPTAGPSRHPAPPTSPAVLGPPVSLSESLAPSPVRSRHDCHLHLEPPSRRQSFHSERLHGSDGTATPQGAVLNPKRSNAWLRWASPTPSFPKAKDTESVKVDKGKGRMVDPSAQDPDGQDLNGPQTSATGIATSAGNCPQPCSQPEPLITADSNPLSALVPATARISVSDDIDDRSGDTLRPPPSSIVAPATMDQDPSDTSMPTSLETAGTAPVQEPIPSRGWFGSWWAHSRTPVPPIQGNGDQALSKSESVNQDDVVMGEPSPVETTPSDSQLQNGSATIPKVTSKANEHSGGEHTNGSASKRRKVDEQSVRAEMIASLATHAPMVKDEEESQPTVEGIPKDAVQEMTEPDIVMEDANATTLIDQDKGTPTPIVQPQSQGWGSYLASWVLPSSTLPATAAEESVPHDENCIEPTDPAEYQRPVHVDDGCKGEHTDELPPEPAKPQPTPALKASEQPTTPLLTPQADTPLQSSPSQQPKLATSSTSTMGWLQLLAFRATQKKITGSTVGSGSPRRSGETFREEVMDLEHDPNFPAAELQEDSITKTKPAAKRRDLEAKTVGSTIEPTKSKSAPSEGPSKNTPDSTKKTVPEEEATKSRPAMGPTKTKPIPEATKCKPAPEASKTKQVQGDNSSMPPPSVSPKTTTGSQRLTHKRSQNLAVLDKQQSNVSNSAGSVRSVNSMPPPSSPRNNQYLSVKANSALPPPPQVPAKQPNMVIPSFETSFDRPPRSLMPHQEATGVAATTWRALSYVVGAHDRDEYPGETRGRKEGRNVGANLPRRIGVGGQKDPDDGWKNVHRVVVVGVHGWFPARMLQNVIGEPTGTSTKFATMMGEAVKRFFIEKGVDESEIRLTLIPLEGEGTIEHRVDKLYKQYLSNPAWINDLRRADAILFAAHSQGCVVTTHLISRMIAQGHIRTQFNREAVARCEWAFGPIAIMPDEASRKGRNLAANLAGADGGRQKVCMLAMCGVHLGPLYSISTSSVIQPYLQWFENAAARELFEFQDTASAVSEAYQKALAMVLENEVRVLLLSSLNDQVVPIYGSSFSTASHPLLLRALFVDGASYSQSDFMTNLLCFAFMLRNAGLDDQRLMEHLSEATAGSLTGVGHSTPYEELACYDLAVKYLFYAGPAMHPLPPLEVEPFAARDPRNEFELPWIMRALVDSPEIKDLFPAELRDLRESIHLWRPQTKALKEIKKRLEPLGGRPRLRPLTASASSASLSSMADPGPTPASGKTPAKPKPKTQSKLRNE